LFTRRRVKPVRTPSAKQKKQTRPNRLSKAQVKITIERTILMIAMITMMIATLAIALSSTSTTSLTLTTRPKKRLTRMLATTAVTAPPKIQMSL